MKLASRTALTAALLAGLILAGCAEEPPVAKSPPVLGPPRLIVRETLPAQPIYIEGTVGFLRIAEVDTGTVVFDGPVTGRDGVRGDDPLFDRELAPGSYRLLSHQRPCNGNCGYLAPPTDRCRTSMHLIRGETRIVTIVLGAHRVCTIESVGGA